MTRFMSSLSLATALCVVSACGASPATSTIASAPASFKVADCISGLSSLRISMDKSNGTITKLALQGTTLVPREGGGFVSKPVVVAMRPSDVRSNRARSQTTGPNGRATYVMADVYSVKLGGVNVNMQIYNSGNSYVGSTQLASPDFGTPSYMCSYSNISIIQSLASLAR